MDPITSLLVVLFAPLVSAGIIAAFFRKSGKVAALVSVLSAGLQMVITLWLLIAWDGEQVAAQVQWMQLGELGIQMGFLLNGLSALMLFVVTFVGFWIHLFAVGYSDDDPARGRFFGGLSIFMFSMTGIVLADNLLMMFVFWELVGFSSYMLISHYTTPEASAAGRKAFVVNRVGDFGFLVGIIWCFWQFGTVSFTELAEITPALQEFGALTAIGLLLFCGVLGKSAQAPLHVWLPDAMAGPTPVSALIHAATMVAAGVFLLGRIFFFFSPFALEIIAVIGCFTAAFAAISAFGVTDIKKILAYSTLSQLGYMVTGFALGTLAGLAGETAGHGMEAAAVFGVGAAMFHLTTHAFFKALLFLGSGSVIHAAHHEQDIYNMGGLWKKMPVTALTFLVGVLAISGIPFFAGFYSKDAILLLAYQHNPVIFWVLAATALLTATYMGRLFYVAFLGKPRSEAAEHAKESSWVMLLPLVALAFYSVVGGKFLMFYPEALAHTIHDTVLHPEAGEKTVMLIVSLVAGLGGLALAFLVYYLPGTRDDTVRQKAPAFYSFLGKRLWFDEIYRFYVSSIQQRVANIIAFLEQVLIEGLLVRGSGLAAEETGRFLRKLQTGSLHGYVYWFAIGIALFWLIARTAF